MSRRSFMPLLALALATSGGGAMALGADTPVVVEVRLNYLNGGRCVSSSLSAATQAEVEVVCSTAEFVGIEANPGKPFTGTQGAASRFYLPVPTLPAGVLVDSGDAHLGAGTVTALHIYNVDGQDGPVEMLVTF